MNAHRRIAFRRIGDAALPHAETLLRRWLPNGRREGTEWVSINPLRDDKRRGSFKINLRTGRWGDFAAGASGGDLTSLASYLFRLSQGEAAKKIAEAVGVEVYE
jgi:hypothetical protein